jgi:hypothetical protein
LVNQRRRFARAGRCPGYPRLIDGMAAPEDSNQNNARSHKILL